MKRKEMHTEARLELARALVYAAYHIEWGGAAYLQRPKQQGVTRS